MVAKLRVSLEATWNELLQTRRVRKIRGYSGLFELRVPARNGAYRIFFMRSGPEYIALHIIQKKSQQTPQDALELAMQRMQHQSSVAWIYETLITSFICGFGGC